MRILAENEPRKDRPNKARAIIHDVGNNVLITNYDGCLMFPGGKLDDGENSLDAAQREVDEETGIVLPEGKKLFTFQLTASKYPERDGSITMNRLVETDYFSFEIPKFELGERKLTDKERAGKFQLKIINTMRLMSFIENHATDNERWPFFKEEIGLVACRFLELMK